MLVRGHVVLPLIHVSRPSEGKTWVQVRNRHVLRHVAHRLNEYKRVDRSLLLRPGLLDNHVFAFLLKHCRVQAKLESVPALAWGVVAKTAIRHVDCLTRYVAAVGPGPR